MKVLILTYYWPPAGGSGVQRWLKFVKYLRDFGIEPVVYTVDTDNYPIEDLSLLDEVPNGVKVIKHPIIEPNNVFSFFKVSKQQSSGFLKANPSIFQKILQYIRANFFIPDARKFWIKPSVKFLQNYLQNSDIDLVITSGPPHSLHLIGNALKKKCNMKWISDFRDPWTDIDYFHQLPLSKKSKKKHFKLEQEVLENSDAVLVVGKTMKDNYDSYNDSIHIITNGYDTVSDIKENLILDKSFSITHIGLMNADRNPEKLWDVLSELCAENEDFKNDLEIKLIGKIASEVSESLKKYRFKNITKIDYLPHQEVVSFQKQSQVLLLSINKVPSAKGIITGKIFEYLQAKRPILAIGPEDGDLAEILSATKSGYIFDFNNKKELKEKILELYISYKNGSLQIKSQNIEKYHRRTLTEQLANIIKETIKL